jgi:hypothetical protein
MYLLKLFCIPNEYKNFNFHIPSRVRIPNSPTYPLPERISACEAKDRVDFMADAKATRRLAAVIIDAIMTDRRFVHRKTTNETGVLRATTRRIQQHRFRASTDLMWTDRRKLVSAKYVPIYG